MNGGSRWAFGRRTTEETALRYVCRLERIGFKDLLAGSRGRTGQAPFHKLKCPVFAGHLDQLSMLYTAWPAD